MNEAGLCGLRAIAARESPSMLKVDAMEDSKRARRRRHGAELKAQVLSECAELGASVAKVALAHGLNANRVHKWRRRTLGAGAMLTPACEAAFIQLPMAARWHRPPL
jgi:transposase